MTDINRPIVNRYTKSSKNKTNYEITVMDEWETLDSETIDNKEWSLDYNFISPRNDTRIVVGNSIMNLADIEKLRLANTKLIWKFDRNLYAVLTRRNYVNKKDYTFVMDMQSFIQIFSIGEILHQNIKEKSLKLCNEWNRIYAPNFKIGNRNKIDEVFKITKYYTDASKWQLHLTLSSFHFVRENINRKNIKMEPKDLTVQLRYARIVVDEKGQESINYHKHAYIAELYHFLDMIYDKKMIELIYDAKEILYNEEVVKAEAEGVKTKADRKPKIGVVIKKVDGQTVSVPIDDIYCESEDDPIPVNCQKKRSPIPKTNENIKKKKKSLLLKSSPILDLISDEDDTKNDQDRETRMKV